MSSQRIERCYTDNIYLIESLPPEEEFPCKRKYLIMGNSGRTYRVTISNRPNCTCPDYINRANRCKHIYFVLIRIMQISNYTDREYSDDELLAMFENIPEVAKNLMYEGEKPQEEKEVNQKFDKGDICPICLDPLENGKELDYCKYSCGKTIHKKCFSMWEKSKGGICVFCRAKWYSNFPSLNSKKVSMHPIEDIQMESEDKKDEEENNYESIDIEKEDDDIEEEKIYKEKLKGKKKKKRDKSRDKSRNKKKNKKSNRKNEEKDMSISESRSRSRSRSISKNKKKKKIRYPKD